MLGKQKCRILKEIRQRIAEENDIPYVTRECSYQGDCRGTCPKCEAELRYLEQELQKRQAMGKKVAVAALCAGMALGAASCGPTWTAPELSGDIEEAPPVPVCTQAPENDPRETEVGEISYPEDVPTVGEPTPEPDDDGEGWELEGDVLYLPDEPERDFND